MPHTKSGAELKVGDRVMVECVVKAVQAGTDFCNCTIETVEPMFPGDQRSTITLNAKQVEHVIVSAIVPAEGDGAGAA